MPPDPGSVLRSFVVTGTDRLRDDGAAGCSGWRGDGDGMRGTCPAGQAPTAGPSGQVRTGITAVASISTMACGSTRPHTWTTAMAGKWRPMISR